MNMMFCSQVCVGYVLSRVYIELCLQFAVIPVVAHVAIFPWLNFGGSRVISGLIVGLGAFLAPLCYNHAGSSGMLQSFLLYHSMVLMFNMIV